MIDYKKENFDEIKIKKPIEKIAYNKIIAKIFVMICILFVRLYFAHTNVPQLKLNIYWRQVLLPILILSLLSFVLGKAFVLYSGVNSFAVSSLFIFAVSLLSSFYIGLSKRERALFIRMLKTKLKK